MQARQRGNDFPASVMPDWALMGIALLEQFEKHYSSSPGIKEKEFFKTVLNMVFFMLSAKRQNLTY
jgi:hypothetical protein